MGQRRRPSPRCGAAQRVRRAAARSTAVYSAAARRTAAQKRRIPIAAATLTILARPPPSTDDERGPSAAQTAGQHDVPGAAPAAYYCLRPLRKANVPYLLKHPLRWQAAVRRCRGRRATPAAVGAMQPQPAPTPPDSAKRRSRGVEGSPRRSGAASSVGSASLERAPAAAATAAGAGADEVELAPLGQPVSDGSGDVDGDDSSSAACAPQS